MFDALWYKLRHMAFKWNVDNEGDIVLSIVGVIHLIKYKEHTMVVFGKRDYKPAPKYLKGY